MSETKDNLAVLAADVESALARRRSRSAAAISWIREAALLPVLAVLIVVGSDPEQPLPDGVEHHRHRASRSPRSASSSSASP